MQKIVPCLWFDDQAEEAVNFYLSIFKDGKILRISRYGDEGLGQPGSVLTIEFQLEGQDFIALNGGSVYTFSPAISLLVNCETQEEVDHLWDSLSAGGEVQQCGWLQDKFGVTWQIVPTILGELMHEGKDPARISRVTKAMLQMVKLDIEVLKQAYEQG